MNSKNIIIWISLGLVLSSIICISFFGIVESAEKVPSEISTLPPENLTWNPVMAGMIETMNKTQIYNTIDMLQRIPTRKFGTTGNLNASELLFERLSGIRGLQVEYEGKNINNVIATLPGINKTDDEIVMVGAHYDSISSDPARAPGATDNACGVAIVLELARIMSQYQFNHTIKFALWNGEEIDHRGSRAYAEYAYNNSLNIPLYVNFDASCYDPKGHYILDIMYNNQSAWAQEIMTRFNTLYGINFTLTYNISIGGSDHQSFWKYGYPAVWTHSESKGPIHTPSDTINLVSLRYALKNGQLGMALLAQIAEVQGMSTNLWNRLWSWAANLLRG